MFRLSLLLLPAVLLSNPGHEQQNPIYQQLRKEGVPVSGSLKVPLPAPLMADGLTAAQQKAVIQKLIARDFTPEQFLYKSVVAPQILHINTVDRSDPKSPVQRVDTYFVSYGDLDKIAQKPFLDELLKASEQDGQGRDLTAAELRKRGIKPPQGQNEGFGHADFTFLNQVRLQVTGHSYWTRTEDSVLLATNLDPRFLKDPQFPNQWRSILTRGGVKQLGPPHPYNGVGYYLKITKLAEPKGALFVESHVVFVEPYDWFDGRNLLRSKLPPVVQDKVRNMRKLMFRKAQ